jgi:hypothetical protein
MLKSNEKQSHSPKRLNSLKSEHIKLGEILSLPEVLKCIKDNHIAVPPQTKNIISILLFLNFIQIMIFFFLQLKILITKS